MKIIDVAEFYSSQGGGVRTYLHQKLAASARLGHQTVIIAPGPADGEDILPGGKIVWVKSPILPVDRRYHYFWRRAPVDDVIRRENPDILEASSPWRGGWIVRDWHSDAPLVKILFMHADPVASYPHVVLRGLLSRGRIDHLFDWFWAYLRRLSAPFDATVVSGQWLADRFARFGLKNPVPVPFGVDHVLFSPDLRDAAMRRSMLAECKLGEDAALLITIGRHHPEKRIAMMMRAVKRANRTRPVGLFIVGDGLIRKAIERKAKRTPTAFVAGQVSDRTLLARMLASSDALIHGCASETYGLAAAEAMAAGVPLIVPDAGGTSDLAAPQYAEIYEAHNEQAMTAAILRFLGRDRAALSAAALAASAVRVGPPEAHFDRLFEYYADLLAQKTRADIAVIAPVQAPVQAQVQASSSI